jgi:hypothetical protein
MAYYNVVQSFLTGYQVNSNLTQGIQTMWFIALLPIWWIFTVPGRYIVWRNYTFPGHGVGPWYSKRQYDSKIVMILYSAHFWLFWLVATFVLSGVALVSLMAVYHATGPESMSPFWLATYSWLNADWVAHLSLNLMLDAIKVALHWYAEFLHNSLPVHVDPALQQPQNLNSVLNNNN